MPSSNTHNRSTHRRESDNTSEYRITWRHAGLGVSLSLLGLYVTLILGGMAFSDWHIDQWPAQLHSVILTGLAVAVISSVVLVVGDGIRQAVREQAGAEEEETEPMGFRPRPWPVGAGVYVSKVANDGQVAYAVPRVPPSPRSAGEMADGGLGIEAAIDRAVDRLADKLRVRLAEEYMAGSQATLDRIMAESDGTVLRLPQMRG